MNRLLATTSIALLAATTPGWAEITPTEVWDHMVQQYQSMGYTVTEGSRDEAGDTLTITDAKMAFDGASGETTMTFPKVVMNQTGDGNVRWSMDGSLVGEVTVSGPEDQKQVITYKADLPGNETVTSGTVEDLTHDFKADQILFTMDMPVGDSGEVLPLSMTLDGVAGKQHSVRGDTGEETSFESTASKLTMGMKGDMPETAEGGPGSLAFDGVIDGLVMNGRMLVAPGEFNMETQLVEALEAGTAFEGNLSYAGSNGTFAFSGPGEDGTPQNGDGKYTSGAGSAIFALSKAGMNYASTGEAIDATVTIGSLPFPINYQLAKGAFDFEMPVLASDQPAPFKLLTSITDLVINDEVWGLFDPEAKLPRDPADLNIDVSGELLMTESILTPPTGMGAPMDDHAANDTADAEADVAEAVDAANAAADAAAAAADAAADAETAADAATDAVPPADGTADAGTDMAEAGTDAPDMAEMPQPPVPVKVTLNDVSINAVGAQAKFSGELNAPEGGDMMTAPVGEIQGEFNGVNALLDTLGAMGLIPEEQMMGARMMLAMFAKPVEGQPEKLETKLEFREGGSIFANGQQVK